MAMAAGMATSAVIDKEFDGVAGTAGKTAGIAAGTADDVADFGKKADNAAPSGTKFGDVANVDGKGSTNSINLPEYDGTTTHGVMVLDDGTQVPFVSGNGDPRYTNYANNGHVEQKTAIYMNENNIQNATLYHNNVNGTCGFCNNMTPTFLPEGASLTVIPPSNAVPNNSRAIAVPKTYIGNNKVPQISNKYKGD